MSRSSSASREPVEAPEGEDADPFIPQASKTSACTVGLPRESSTSLAITFTILDTQYPRRALSGAN